MDEEEFLVTDEITMIDVVFWGAASIVCGWLVVFIVISTIH